MLSFITGSRGLPLVTLQLVYLFPFRRTQEQIVVGKGVKDSSIHSGRVWTQKFAAYPQTHVKINHIVGVFKP